MEIEKKYVLTNTINSENRTEKAFEEYMKKKSKPRKKHLESILDKKVNEKKWIIFLKNKLNNGRINRL